MVYQFRMNRSSDRNDNSGKLPVYLQIAEQLSREISAGLLAEGQRLPAERQMAKDYNVTVRTLRKSLARLTETGLLARKQGSGNYIQKNENADSIYSFFRLERPQGGGLPSANLVRVDSLKKPKDLPVEWVRVQIKETTEVNGVRFPSGIQIDVTDEDAKQMLDSDKAILLEETDSKES